MRDRRLVLIGITAHVINGTVDRLRMIGIHECAGAIIDGLPGDRHVVGIHHAVDKPDQLPLCHQGRLPLDHRIQQSQIRFVHRGQIRVVSVDHMIREQCQRLSIAASGKVLEGADPNMTAGNPGQHSTGQAVLPDYLFTGQHRRQ